MVNRGRLVHADGRPVEPFWEHEHWITCRIYPEPESPPVTPRQYTELSFLDEATACAAGHRPCFQCRRPEANAFLAKWREVHCATEKASEIDARPHRERLDEKKETSSCANLPFGAMVKIDGRAWLVVDKDGLYAWNPDGYSDQRAFPPGHVAVLTPPSIVAVMRAGWRPGWRPTLRASARR